MFESKADRICIFFLIDRLDHAHLDVDLLCTLHALIIACWVAFCRVWLDLRWFIHGGDEGSFLGLEDCFTSISIILFWYDQLEFIVLTFMMLLRLDCHSSPHAASSIPHHAVKLDLVREENCVVKDW